jgi:hypothetical protein
MCTSSLPPEFYCHLHVQIPSSKSSFHPSSSKCRHCPLRVVQKLSDCTKISVEQYVLSGGYHFSGYFNN